MFPAIHEYHIFGMIAILVHGDLLTPKTGFGYVSRDQMTKF